MLDLETSNFGFIFDFINLLVILLFIFICFKKNLINNFGFIILTLFSLTPILGNDIFFNFNIFPDQSKYIINVIVIRENYFTIIGEILNGEWEIFHNRFQIALGDQYLATRYASLLIASMPIPFVETVRSVGFCSKFIFIFWFVYLIFNQKKFNKNENYYYYLLLLSPSILIYSSIALKEIFILVFFHLCMFFTLYKKPLFFIFSLGMLALFRVELLILIGIFFIIYNFIFLHFSEQKISKPIQKIFKILLVILILATLSIFINDLYLIKNYLNLFIEKVNAMKLGYHEEGDLNSQLRLYSYDFSIIPMIYDTFNAILSPTFSKSNNAFLPLLLIENFLLNLLFVFYFIFLVKFNFLKSIFYIIFFLILNLSVGMLVVNDMAIYRYKITILIPLILIIREEILNYRNENIIFNKS